MNTAKDFLISALPIDPFVALFKMTDTELAAQGARRCIADSKPGFPCRISLVDAEIGEEVILLPYAHHDVSSPYRSSGPIYVRIAAQKAKLNANEIPEVVRPRLMSARAYDAAGWMVASDVVEGRDLAPRIERFFADEKVAYLHLHNARAGCYSCRVDRA